MGRIVKLRDDRLKKLCTCTNIGKSQISAVPLAPELNFLILVCYNYIQQRITQRLVYVSNFHCVLFTLSTPIGTFKSPKYLTTIPSTT